MLLCDLDLQKYFLTSYLLWRLRRFFVWFFISISFEFWSMAFFLRYSIMIFIHFDGIFCSFSFLVFKQRECENFFFREFFKNVWNFIYFSFLLVINYVKKSLFCDFYLIYPCHWQWKFDDFVLFSVNFFVIFWLLTTKERSSMSIFFI